MPTGRQIQSSLVQTRAFPAVVPSVILNVSGRHPCCGYSVATDRKSHLEVSTQMGNFFVANMYDLKLSEWVYNLLCVYLIG